MSKSHFDMVDAVNDAKTADERSIAEAELRGWRLAADYFGRGWSGIAADIHTMERHGAGVDMCCGVIFNTVAK